MARLIDILTDLDADTLLNDGATTWDPDGLMSHVDDDGHDYVLREDGIYRIGDDGYQASVAAYKIVTE